MTKVTVHEQNYEVTSKGHGAKTLAIGISTLLERTLSDTFHEKFEVYYSDLYWVDNNAQPNSMDEIIDDIAEVITQLEISKCILLAHSAFGIVALEFAKKYPEMLSGIIMIGTPVNSNAEVAKQNEIIFQSNADEYRKRIDQSLKEKLGTIDLSNSSMSDTFITQYVHQSARYWHKPDYDCTYLWDGIVMSPLVEKFFTTILPSVNVQNDLEKVNTPIFHAIGMSDFDCCPWTWEDAPNKPRNMDNIIFNSSGHWPHYEETELFDSKVSKWLEDII